MNDRERDRNAARRPAILRHAREGLGLSRLVCLVDPANAASIGVARSIAMTFEAEMEDEKGPFQLYSTGP